MEDRGADFVRNLVGEDQRAFLMATRAEASAAAGEGHEHFMTAVGAFTLETYLK